MQWDLFCRVVDNFGDVGVCWRLAADLASRGEQVRLWLDDASALAWMAPQREPGVTVLPWGAPPVFVSPGDVVVEAFGCDPPVGFVNQMRERAIAPVWINLEYLSAEPALEPNHALPSPQLSGAGRGLTKWFFYPGFSARTGGLIRETGLMAARYAFDEAAWLRGRGVHRRVGERVVSLFCYPNPRAAELLDALAVSPTLLLATAGHAADQVRRELGPTLARGALRAVVLPYLSQQDFDALLWACDLNFVRGEDSFVRAQWAGRPFVWQIYPQQDGAHAAKLTAFLDRFLADADADLANPVRALWRGWNGLAGEPLHGIDLPHWRPHCEAWCGSLLAQPDLAQQLIRFAAERR